MTAASRPYLSSIFHPAPEAPWVPLRAMVLRGWASWVQKSCWVFALRNFWISVWNRFSILASSSSFSMTSRMELAWNSFIAWALQRAPVWPYELKCCLNLGKACPVVCTKQDGTYEQKWKRMSQVQEEYNKAVFKAQFTGEESRAMRQALCCSRLISL